METLKKVIDTAESTVDKVTAGLAKAAATMDMDAKSKELSKPNTTVEDPQPGNYITTNFGTRIHHTDDSLKVGERGPTLMEDFHLREKITHFDHERIPERVVHARGFGAHGYFQVYDESLEEYTCADFLCHPSKKTPVFVRFSTVLGSKGSADTVRDVRGFATKFYTDQGNFDLVGNNMPVFFIQDGIKFPDVIHAGKPEPHNEMPQAATAHDNFWDFISLTPESTHMIMWALSDRAIPRSYRTMEGFGVHTFVLVNAEGRRSFVKFHWKPRLGVHSLVWDEALKLCGVDPDFHRRDLWDAIEAGQYPEWELGMQIFDEQQAEQWDFDVLDPTKIVPEELIPVKRVGRMVLNRNSDNVFAETEQAAFHTAHLVPGIESSHDPLLQARNFSYTDTQLIRLGGPNFQEIPINRPLCPVTNNQRDGYHRMTINKGKVNYFPNRFGCPGVAPLDKGGYEATQVALHGDKVRAKSPKFHEFYNQARMFFLSMSDWEKEHIIKAASFELGKCDDLGVRQRMVQTLNKVDYDMACRVAKAIGVAPPAEPATVKYERKSPALSQAHQPSSIQSRRVAFLVGPSFSFEQLTGLSTALAAQGAINMVVGPHKGEIQGEGGSSTAQFSYFTCKSVMFDAVVVVGGSNSVATLAASGDAKAFVTEAFKHGKPIACVDEGVDFLRTLPLPATLKMAGPGGDVVEHQGVVTLKGFTEAALTVRHEGPISFIQAFVHAMSKHRHFERDDYGVPA